MKLKINEGKEVDLSKLHAEMCAGLGQEIALNQAGSIIQVVDAITGEPIAEVKSKKDKAISIISSHDGKPFDRKAELKEKVRASKSVEELKSVLEFVIDALE